MGSRILIVDDEPGVRSMLSIVFKRAGFDVTVACDVAEAKALIAGADPFEVVLSDVRMPGQTGHDLVRWLAVEYPATRVVLMSGCNLDCTGCPFNRGCQLLMKPFLPNQALAAVEKVLAQSRAA